MAQLKQHICEANVIVPEIMVSASPSLCEDDRKTDAFLDEVHKKKVSDEIRQRKQEKKLSEVPFGQHVVSQDSSSITSESFHCEADLSMTNTKHALPEQVVKELAPKESSLVLMEPQKIGGG